MRDYVPHLSFTPWRSGALSDTRRAPFPMVFVSWW